MTFNNNNSSQAERKQVLKDTMFNRASSEAGEISGRWAKPTQVRGSEGAVHMPRMPANSPWAAPDPSGQEQPFGIDVSEPVVTGEAFEVEASLDADLGLQRMLRNPDRDRPDGVPPPTGSPVSRSPEPTPDSEVVRGAAEEPAPREPLSLSGRHSTSRHRVSPNNLMRRLV